MKRYFLVADRQMPKLDQPIGHWHAIHLGSHGAAGKGHNLVVLVDDHVRPPKGWKPLPHLVDARTPLKAHVDHGKLADLGLSGEETMLEAAIRFAAIHPLFAH